MTSARFGIIAKQLGEKHSVKHWPYNATVDQIGNALAIYHIFAASGYIYRPLAIPYADASVIHHLYTA